MASDGGAIDGTSAAEGATNDSALAMDAAQDSSQADGGGLTDASDGAVRDAALEVPRQITGLFAWFKADRGIIKVDGGNGVATWQDQSGNGHDANAPSAAGTQPTFAVAGMNGKDALYFNGAQTEPYPRLRTTAFAQPLAQPATFFVASQHTQLGQYAAANHFLVDGLSTSSRLAVGAGGNTLSACGAAGSCVTFFQYGGGQLSDVATPTSATATQGAIWTGVFESSLRLELSKRRGGEGGRSEGDRSRFVRGDGVRRSVDAGTAGEIGEIHHGGPRPRRIERERDLKAEAAQIADWAKSSKSPARFQRRSRVVPAANFAETQPAPAY